MDVKQRAVITLSQIKIRKTPTLFSLGFRVLAPCIDREKKNLRRVKKQIAHLMDRTLFFMGASWTTKRVVLLYHTYKRTHDILSISYRCIRCELCAGLHTYMHVFPAIPLSTPHPPPPNPPCISPYHTRLPCGYRSLSWRTLRSKLAFYAASLCSSCSLLVFVLFNDGFQNHNLATNCELDSSVRW